MRYIPAYAECVKTQKQKKTNKLYLAYPVVVAISVVIIVGSRVVVCFISGGNAGVRFM